MKVYIVEYVCELSDPASRGIVHVSSSLDLAVKYCRAHPDMLMSDVPDAWHWRIEEKAIDSQDEGDSLDAVFWNVDPVSGVVT